MKKFILVYVLFLLSFSSISFADEDAQTEQSNNTSKEETFDSLKHLLVEGTEILIDRSPSNSNSKSYQLGVISGLNYDGSINVNIFQNSIKNPSYGNTTFEKEELKNIHFRCIKGSKFPKCNTTQAQTFIRNGVAVYTNGHAVKLNE